MVVAFALANSQAKTDAWQTNYAKAAQLAKTQGKPIFIDFTAEWCGPCKMMESDVFSTAKVKGLLSKAICVRIDIDKNPGDAKRFGVNSIPRLIMLKPDGKTTLWDAVGYRDADMFADEFKEALGLKGTVATVEVAAEPPALVKVTAALTKGSFAQLKAADPAVAQKGLAMLVAKLGVFQAKDFKPTAALIQKAGKDAYPALVAGMQHKYLAVRVGAYRVMQNMLGDSRPRELSFDPWAATKTRQTQIQAWRRWLQAS